MNDDNQSSGTEAFAWNGALLTWRQESWPCFDNRNQSERPFFAKAFPCGTKWVGEIVADLGQVLLKTRSESPQASPVDALEAASLRLRREFARIFSAPTAAAMTPLTSAEMASGETRL